MSKFKILWIDDNREKIELEMDKLKCKLEQLGFQPEIKYMNSINLSEISPDKTIGADLKARIYDLIFIDFKLKGMLGSDIISEMRKINNIYTDIVFYSSDGEELKKKVKDSYYNGMLEFIDDVHIAILDDGDYDEKVEKVLDKVINSWYSPSSFRGIVLDKTCKFEKNTMKLINFNFRTLELADCKSNIINSLSQNKLTGAALRAFNNILTHKELESFLNDKSHIFNWTFKYKLLKYYVDINPSYNCYKSILAILKEIFEVRNAIAHNEIEIVNACLVVHLKEGDHTYNESKFKEVINKINKIDLAFEKNL